MVATFSVRPATKKDAAAWFTLLEELAVFEKLAPPDAAARRRLARDAFGPKPKITVLLGFDAHGNAAAYAILAWTYSSFLGKPTLWIEDIFVTETLRGGGLAHEMLRHIALRAKAQRAGRIEGVVLDWNTRAHRFYEKTGATLKREWILLRYDENAIAALATGKGNGRSPRKDPAKVPPRKRSGKI